MICFYVRNGRFDLDHRDRDSRDVCILKKEAMNKKTRVEHADVTRRIFRLSYARGKKRKKTSHGVARGAFGLLVISH